MSRLGFYVLCGALCSLVLIGQGAVSREETKLIDLKTTTLPPTTAAPTEYSSTKTAPTSPETTTPKPEPITTPKPEPTPTPKPEPTTTPKPEPTTTPKPEPTTTPKPEPTTTSSTTTPKPEPTTTPVTTTSKPTPPTTPPTPKPTPPAPLPPPSVGNYTVQEDNVTCIVVQFAAKLNITYTSKKVDNATELSSVIMNVPANATTEGSCSANNQTEQWLKLSWTEGSLNASTMTLVFRKNGTNYVLQNLTVTVPADLFPNASLSKPVELSYGMNWQTPLSTSYRCDPATALNLTAGPEQSALVGILTLSHLQEEAFRTSADTKFSAARDCSSGGDLPDTIPIAVGCALGGLVLVVLVAYLVGRRRSAARGYLSM